MGGMLKGALYGLAQGGIGGAIGGAITGAASPKTIAGYQDRMDTAQWEKTHDSEVDEANEILRMQNIGEDNRRANRALGIQEESNRINQGFRRDAQTETARQHRATVARDNLVQFERMHPGEPYPYYITEFYPAYLGKTAPKKPGPAPRAFVKTEMGEDGIEYGMTPEGQWEPMETAEGEPFRRGFKPERGADRIPAPQSRAA